MNTDTEDARQWDPLLKCVARFTELYSSPVPIQSLVAGLPVKPGAAGPELFSVDNSKGLFSRVAKRAGFRSRLIQREIADLSNLLLPCILVLKDGNACILEKVDADEGIAKVIYPEIEQAEDWVSLDELATEYLGYAFLLKKRYHYQSRQQHIAADAHHHWFWGTLGRAKAIFLNVIVASIVINLFILATPIFTMNVYDRVVPNDAIETLWVLAVGVLIVYMVDLVLRFLRTYLLEIAGKKSDVIMSSILYEQVMGLRMDVWPKSVGVMANTLREFESIRSFFTSATLVSLVDIPFVVIFLIAIAYISGPAVLVPIVSIAILLIYSAFLIKPLRESIESTYQASAAKHALLVENLHSIHAVKTMGVSHHSQWEWEEATGDIATKSLRSRMLSGSITIFTQFLMQLSTVGLLIVGVYQVQALELTLGGLIAIVILSSRAVAPIAQVASLVANYQQTKTAYLQLDEIMRQPVERPEEKRYVKVGQFKGEFRLDNVDFTYSGNEWSTLKGVSLHIKPGERIGVVGKIGSGKSTLANMLIGLYRPDSGAILIDDIDQQQIDPAELRRNIAYLSQEAGLFRGTVRDNILYKDPHSHDEVMLNASRLGGVDLFINRSPHGFDTAVGEQGAGLSGGQRQSVALARTLLLESPVVVLDEPTSLMDNTTESQVRQRLLEYTKDRTLILITHKSEMLELVDRLLVVDDGRIVLDGPKDQVIQKLREN